MGGIKVNLIGAGRVGQTFLTLLNRLPDCEVQDVYSASPSSAKTAVDRAGAGRVATSLSDMLPADLWVIAVPDTQISTVASALTATLTPADPMGQQPVAFHCSGFFPADEIAALRRLNWHLASVHPVLSFADPDTAIEQFTGTLCGLEGDADALVVLKPLLERIGAECFTIQSDGKSLYHAAAVISNNFAVVLQAIAREAWTKAGVADEIIPLLNAKLIESTAKNVVTMGPQDALTGPAARGDKRVVTKQGLDVANWHPKAGDIYKSLSDMAADLKRTGSTNPSGKPVEE